MCNNNGHCRKFDAGTMCPSYRVTRDEEHLTRGRANTLRLALSGQLGGGLASDAVRDALDLCVSCKGCRRECPTGVDMAKMKIEFLHHYHRQRGLSIKDRLIAYLPRYAHWGARLPWLLNLRNTMPGAAALSREVVRILGAAVAAAWRSDTFLGGLTYPINADGSVEPQCAAMPAKSCCSPTRSTTPSSPRLRTLRSRCSKRPATRVHIALPADGSRRPLCCGRTFLATGLVDEAKIEARRTSAALMPYVERGATVVGLEPSCLLSMRDEFLAMGLGDAAQRLASSALLIEEFLAREHRAGRLAPASRAAAARSAR